MTSIQKKSKSFSKPGSSAVQASRDANSAQSQDMPSYSKAGADFLAGSIMRSLETEEPSEVEASTGKRQSEPGRAAVAATAPPIVSILVVQPNSVGIQRQCSECAEKQQQQSEEEGKDVLQMSQAASGIQRKLTVGAIGDVYEQEADRVAAQVMSMPRAAAGPQVQRFGEEPSPVGMYSSLARSITPVVHRRVDDQVQMYSVVQRAFQAGGTQASGDLESRLNASSGGGSALAPEVRAFMEPRFGADFSSVRVHTGGEAVQMNRELGAQAFAHGNDIYFGEGKSPGNNELTAHELTHVVQQGGGIEFPVQRQPELMASTQLPALPSFIPASVLRQIGSRVSQKVLWQTFWKVVIKRFGIRGTAAAAISLADGPLPVGELISIGIAIATLWDLFRLWNALWEQTAEVVTKKRDEKPSTMRFQVQWNTDKGGPTFSQVATAPSSTGVTTAQATIALEATVAKVTPDQAQEAALPAKTKQINWIKSRPTAGIAVGGYSKSEYFRYKKFTDARVDVENLRGHNLRV